jgi:hypothetical protein
MKIGVGIGAAAAYDIREYPVAALALQTRECIPEAGKIGKRHP